jgi:hypothetical protein
MQVGQAFPNTRTGSGVPQHPIWHVELSLASLYNFDALLGQILEMRSRIGMDEFNQIAKNIIEDCIAAKLSCSEDELIRLDFIQFSNAVECASFNAGRGEFTNTHDYLVWALVDEINYGAEASFQLERISAFLASNDTFIALNAMPTLFQWLEILFYYSRHHGGLQSLSDLVYENYLTLIQGLLSNGIPQSLDAGLLVNATCQMLSWGINNKKTSVSSLVQGLESILASQNEENRKTISIQLAAGGAVHSTKTSAEWAEDALNHFPDLLTGHEAVHLYAIFYSDNLETLVADTTNWKEATETYTQSLLQVGSVSLKYERSRIFGTIQGLIIRFLEEGKAKLAISLICDFYDIDEECRNDEDILFLLPNYRHGPLYAKQGNPLTFDRLSDEQYVDVVLQSNRFLSATVTLNDVPDFPLEEPQRLGIPVKEEGERFEELLQEFYQFDKIPTDFLDNLQSMIIVPGYQHPIQSMMLKTVGKTIPINASLQASRPFRECSRVLLWCYGTMTSDLEKVIVAQILGSAGLSVEIADILNESKDSFLTEYSSEDYDLIWVATHGNYDHHQPHKSTISILPEIEILLEELISLNPTTDNSRMLFLNICDGATASTLNSLYDIGFGASLSGHSQVVLSHIWPVETVPAMVYGVLYAHFLSSGKDFWAAFTSTIQKLLEGKESVIDTIIEYYHGDDMKDILDQLDDALESNIYYWGSGVFYN